MSAADTRRELIEAVQKLSELVPEMRIGQLLAAVGERCAELPGRGLWDATDEELREAIWRFQDEFANTATTAQQQATANRAN